MNALGNLIEEGFRTASIVNPNGQQFKLGEKAYCVWKSIREEKPKGRIITQLKEKFNIEDDQVETEYTTIIDQLTKIKLIQIT